MPTPSRTISAIAALAVLALTACTPASGSGGSGSAGESGAEATAASASDQPSRIVAVSSDVSDMALLLAGPERMAAVSESSRSPHMGMLPDLARQVEATIPAGVEPDVEQILSHSPDLVLTTARHAGERTAGDQLADAGVESLALSSDDFATPEAYADALLRVGEALGEEDEATKQADALLEGIREVDESTDSGDGPRVLALMARGGTVMAMDGGLMLPGLAVRAGAVDAAAEVGLTGTAPLDAELLVRADPDIILLEDFMGAGEEPFDELLGAEAVQQVPAVASGEVHVVPMTEASAVAGVHLQDGYRTVAGIVSAASATD
jgi:iron complex transport system substrate-binding protein